MARVLLGKARKRLQGERELNVNMQGWNKLQLGSYVKKIRREGATQNAQHSRRATSAERDGENGV